MTTVISTVNYYVQTAYLISVARTCQTSSTILVLYDHAITFDQEINYVWTHPWSFGSISYLFIRYVGDALSILNLFAFIGVHARELYVPLFSTHNPKRRRLKCVDGASSPRPCIALSFTKGEVYFYVQAWIGLLVFFLIQLVLQVRLYALYRGSRIILAFLMSGYLCEVAALSTIMGYVNADTQIVNESLKGLYICADVRSPSFYQTYIFWVPVIVYDSTLFLLALWHCICTWISAYRRADARWTDSIRTITITEVLVAGNAGYFFGVIVVGIVSVVVGQCLGLRWTQVFKGHPATAVVMMGCRLILSLRSSLAQDAGKESYGISDDTPWAAVVNTIGTTLV